MSGLDDIVGSGGGGWAVGENSITLPPDAGTSDPRIYIGPDDPLAVSIGQDAAIVLYFGEDRAFIISVQQSGSDQYGQFSIYSLDPVNGLAQLYQADDDMAGGETNVFIGANLTNGHVGIGNGANFINLQAETRLFDDTIIGDQFSPAPVPSVKDKTGLRYGKVQSETLQITFAAVLLFTQVIVFPIAYPAGVVPNVYVNIDSSAGVTRWYTAKAYNRTNTGFTLLIQTTDAAFAGAAWAAIPVTYSAVLEG